METRDYFISYNNEKDGEWAEWVNNALQGYATTYFQAHDVKGGMNFLDWMNEALKSSKGLIAIWSEHYKASVYCKAELDGAFMRKRDDPSYNILIVRVADSPVDNFLFRGIVHVDLLSPSESKNRDALLDAVQSHLGKS